MKKLQFIVFVLLSVFFCTACDDDNLVSSYVKITVKENGYKKSGVTVCMFDSRKGDDTNFFQPFFADKKVVTEQDGVATFKLEKFFDINRVQTTLYFVVFKDKRILGKTALTIEKGETKTAEIRY